MNSAKYMYIYVWFVHCTHHRVFLCTNSYLNVHCMSSLLFPLYVYISIHSFLLIFPPSDPISTDPPPPPGEFNQTASVEWTSLRNCIYLFNNSLAGSVQFIQPNLIISNYLGVFKFQRLYNIQICHHHALRD